MNLTIPVLSGPGERTTMTVAIEIVAQAQQLPYGHDAYFVLDGAASIVPIANLIWKRARPEGIRNAIERMSLARQGIYPKRRPLKVEVAAGGSYLLIDGNSTALVALAAGWPDIPCEMARR